MPKFMDLELANACYKLMHDLIQVKKGESVLITVDSKAEFRVVEEMAKAAEVLGAKTMVAWHSTPKGYGALTMPYLPEPLIACVDKTDVWVEMNDQWLLYSPIWDKAVTNGRTRSTLNPPNITWRIKCGTDCTLYRRGGFGGPAGIPEQACRHDKAG